MTFFCLNVRAIEPACEMTGFAVAKVMSVVKPCAVATTVTKGPMVRCGSQQGENW